MIIDINKEDEDRCPNHATCKNWIEFRALKWPHCLRGHESITPENWDSKGCKNYEEKKVGFQ